MKDLTPGEYNIIRKLANTYAPLHLLRAAYNKYAVLSLEGQDKERFAAIAVDLLAVIRKHNL